MRFSLAGLSRSHAILCSPRSCSRATTSIRYIYAVAEISSGNVFFTRRDVRC